MRSDFLNPNSNKFGDGADIIDEAMPLQYKEKISLLVDQGAAGAIRSALTIADSADKIITEEPDGDGTGTLNVSADGFNFTAAAVKGSSFRITMISDTAATAFVVSDLVCGLAAGTGAHVAE